MAINTEFPNWMLPKESPIDAMVKGVQMGTALAQTRQTGQRLTLQAQAQAQEVELSNKRFELQAQTQGLQNQLLSQQLDAEQSDLPMLQQFATDVTHANSADDLSAMDVPAFKSPKHYQLAQSMLASKLKVLSVGSEFQAEQAVQKDYLNVLGRYPSDVALTMGPLRKGSPQWNTALQGFVAKSKAEDQDAAFRLRTGPAEIAADARMMTFEARNPKWRNSLSEPDKAAMAAMFKNVQADPDLSPQQKQFKIRSIESEFAAKVPGAAPATTATTEPDENSPEGFYKTERNKTLTDLREARISGDAKKEKEATLRMTNISKAEAQEFGRVIREGQNLDSIKWPEGTYFVLPDGQLGQWNEKTKAALKAKFESNAAQRRATEEQKQYDEPIVGAGAFG